MPRLFVAIDLPECVHAFVTGLLPPAGPDIRPEPLDHLHLTLHFLGEHEMDGVAGALATVATECFPIDVRGVGSFRMRDGASALWVGVTPSDPLLQLHGTVARVLAPLGYVPESRAYRPHITLARCGPSADASTSEWVDAHADAVAPLAHVESFTLFRSAWVDERPSYRRERTFPLG